MAPAAAAALRAIGVDEPAVGACARDEHDPTWGKGTGAQGGQRTAHSVPTPSNRIRDKTQPRARGRHPALQRNLASFLLEVRGPALRETPIWGQREYEPVLPCPASLQVITCFIEYLLYARDGARSYSQLCSIASTTSSICQSCGTNAFYTPIRAPLFFLFFLSIYCFPQPASGLKEVAFQIFARQILPATSKKLSQEKQFSTSPLPPPPHQPA